MLCNDYKPLQGGWYLVSSVSKEVNSGHWGVNQRTKLSKVCGEGELADWPKVAELWRPGRPRWPNGWPSPREGVK